MITFASELIWTESSSAGWENDSALKYSSSQNRQRYGYIGHVTSLVAVKRIVVTLEFEKTQTASTSAMMQTGTSNAQGQTKSPDSWRE